MSTSAGAATVQDGLGQSSVSEGGGVAGHSAAKPAAWATALSSNCQPLSVRASPAGR